MRDVTIDFTLKEDVLTARPVRFSLVFLHFLDLCMLVLGMTTPIGCIVSILIQILEFFGYQIDILRGM